MEAVLPFVSGKVYHCRENLRLSQILDRSEDEVAQLQARGNEF